MHTVIFIGQCLIPKLQTLYDLMTLTDFEFEHVQPTHHMALLGVIDRCGQENARFKVVVDHHDELKQTKASFHHF